MTDTIRGGAYKLPDGSWVNANGKKIPAPKDLPNYEGEALPGNLITAQPVPGSQVMLTVPTPQPPPSAEDEFEKPEEEVTEEDTPAKKRSVSKKVKG
jgi:hypothetical protein